MNRAFVSGIVLLMGANVLMGCHDGDAPSAPAEPVERVASTRAADTAAASTPGAGEVFAVAGSQLQQGSAAGAPWTPVGDAYGVTAMAGFRGALYVASADQLWKRGAIGPAAGNDWSLAGQARGAVAMAYHQGSLFMVSGTTLWQRSAVGPGSDWSYAGDAYGVTAMASYDGHLYVASGNALWQRGAIGPGTGNDWSYAGPAGGITAFTSIPMVCSKGLSAADCPPGNVDLSGLTNVAVGHPATQSSTIAGATAGLGVDADTTTTAATAIEPSPWWSVDLGFDRAVQALSVVTDTPGAVVDLLDASGAVVTSEPVSAFSASNGFQVVAFPSVTARSVRVRASAPAGQPGVSLHVSELQVFAQLVDPSLFRPQDTPDGVCWKTTYGRGAGTPVTACDPGQEENGALCYPACAPGYYGVGPVCWESCPPGWTDTGAFCHLNGSLISADNSGCPWYDECGLTFAWGCSTCPPGYANDGCTCRINPQDFAKASYGRGAGVPLHCTGAQEEQAALCYTPCSAGYDGVGPVCWGECGGDYDVDCAGLACATSASACSDFLTTATASVINLEISLSGFVESFGESYEAISLADAVARGISDADAQSLKETIVARLVAQAEDLNEDVAENTAQMVVGGLMTGQIDWTQMDPTGIAAVVLAFNQSICY